ncbi:DksA/TraR family C4-type zinc finger protein [Shewanella abyssi]|uniref:DksA/TraR family C4-type zinc finger protein n=1 Tax=Shewanella abyssi TaxID=311789 RepID=UPI00200C7316|nr:DksA/TraR family C4-type zinc finger protein [Shewanella abyssi]MCL1049262.1 DksA/TraR family C4-type zinc finger protein [Shewanella abyssi]MCL1049359.1 DksA/TraR family C4-type zinc finger protein [Shewanella abyssi]
MAGGWARDGAVQDQIDNSVADGVAQIRSGLSQQASLLFCEECGSPIPEARRKAIQGVRYCVTCQSELDEQSKKVPLFNRRGSKDSQLR